MAKRNTEAAWVESAQRWQINVQCNGKRKTFVSSKAGKKGKLEAERKADAWLEKGMVDDTAKVSVLLDMFLEDKKTHNGERSGSYRQNEKMVRLYIKPVIGNKKMAALTAGDCQRVIDVSYRTKHLSAKTLSDLRGTISGFLKWARMNKKSALLVEGLTIPKGATRTKRTILQPDALETLMTVDTTVWHGKRRLEPYIWAYRFGVVTGFRPGEIIALKHSDISGKRYSLHGSINDLGDHTDGKNENALRSGELSSIAMHILNRQRLFLIQHGISSNYVFPKVTYLLESDGEHLDQQTYYRSWVRYCRSNNITEGTKPYELRHTFCSVNDEMAPGLKKMIMGHSQNMDTEGVYGHKKRGDDARAAEYIDEAFAPYVKCVPKCVPEE